MSTGIFFLIQSLFYIVLLCIIFFIKKRLSSDENMIYTTLVIITLIEVVLEIILDLLGPMYKQIPYISYPLARIYCVTIILWLTCLCIYVVVISLKMKKKEISLSKILVPFCITTPIFVAMVMFLPIYFFYDGNLVYTHGLSVDVVFYISFLYSFVAIIFLLLNIKRILDRRFIPMLLFLLIGGACGFIQMMFPGLLLATAVHAFITFLMYFTIENPDLKMIDELQKNRALTESSMEDKSLFMFKMSQEVKQPLKNIDNIINEYNNIDLKKEDTKKLLSVIEANVDNLNFVVNNIINVSDIDLSKVKIVDTSYDVRNFFESIRKQAEVKLKEKEKVSLRYEITDAIPEELYGDYIKLKQIITTIINNSIKYTEEGIIQLDIDAITRYDLCRLIIKIRDTGCGMPLDQINEILRNNYEFEESEYKKLDKLHLTLEMSIKLIRMLGGNVNIKSDIDHGTEITIIIDQKVKEQEKTEISNDIDKYSTSIFGNRRVLIVDDDSDEINKIVKILTKDNVQTNISMFGKDCIDKIKVGEKYKLILMDDEMKPDNALPTLKKLKEIKKFNIPVIVMLNKEKEFIKEHYIKDGFTDYLLKDDLEKELKRIIEKHL